jgi:hypothetical protein
MKLVPTVLSNKLAPRMLKLEAGSPKILFGVGVVSMVGSTVLACRSTLKLEEVLDRAQDNLRTAQQLVEAEDPRYTEEDQQKDKLIIYTRSAVEIGKLYGPSLVLGVAGITCLTKSHNILQERNAALTAAYVALDKGFKEYRARVVEKYGTQEDQEMRYGAEKIQVEDEKTGRKKTIVVAPKGEPSIYARFFDELALEWQREPEYNLAYLKCQQAYANHLLNARGHVFLNEVYKSLGIPHSSAGAVVGWVLGNGDNYVDFGIWDANNEKAREFVNGHEAAILLDFNVDGVIYDLIDKKNENQREWMRG